MRIEYQTYAPLNLNLPYLISDVSNWDNVCSEIIPYAIKMKEVFSQS